ncbi:MAG: T9SS type A sorting domain-containing protein [Flavobacteriales bacterium]|nr:T9SS type A sorting domain-containing protein [Flavobacteriales bacterium]
MLELSQDKYIDPKLITNIFVYDVIGKQVSKVTYSIGQSQTVLNCSLLSPGSYLVKVFNQNGEQFYGKLIKK